MMHLASFIVSARHGQRDPQKDHIPDMYLQFYSPCAKKNRLARVVMVLTASVSVCMYVCRVVCLGWWRWCLELVALYGWMVLQGDVGGYNASEGWKENIYERNLRSEMSRVI